MKKSGLVLVAILAVMAGVMAAQDAGLHSAMSAKTVTLAGKVSADGQVLTGDKDSNWKVTNPEALKGHEGLQVSVKCHTNKVEHEIQVLSVRKMEPRRYLAN